MSDVVLRIHQRQFDICKEKLVDSLDLPKERQLEILETMTILAGFIISHDE